MDATPKTVREAQNKCFEDIKCRLPKEIWEAAEKEADSCNNYGLWTRILIAVEMLSEFWQDEHNSEV